MHARQDSFRPSPVRRPPEGLKPLGPGILILLGFGANRSSSETGAPRRRNGPQAKLACWLTPSHRQARVSFHLCPVSSRVVVPTRRRYPPTVYLQALGKQYRKREYPPVYPERKLFQARTNDPRREVLALPDLPASVQDRLERSLRERFNTRLRRLGSCIIRLDSPERSSFPLKGDMLSGLLGYVGR